KILLIIQLLRYSVQTLRPLSFRIVNAYLVVSIYAYFIKHISGKILGIPLNNSTTLKQQGYNTFFIIKFSVLSRSVEGIGGKTGEEKFIHTQTNITPSNIQGVRPFSSVVTGQSYMNHFYDFFRISSLHYVFILLLDFYTYTLTFKISVDRVLLRKLLFFVNVIFIFNLSYFVFWKSRRTSLSGSLQM
ncbi:hypothetical protein L9F63_019971, partial [Diploptera punctata]